MTSSTQATGTMQTETTNPLFADETAMTATSPQPGDGQRPASLLRECGFQVVAETSLAGRAAVLSPLPESLAPAVLNILQAGYPDGLYSHQARAIAAAVGGQDVCLATATSSGKSLVFMTAAMDLLAKDPQARVLVLYPVKALIQDQMGKWEGLLKPLGARPGLIDGDVPTAQRNEVLMRHRVVLMTPDVVHAWLMSHLAERPVANFRQNLRLVVLDEAHVYDGVFGTNMAFLLRRLQAVSAPLQFICSTATLGAAADFMLQLTGRRMCQFDGSSDGSRVSPKHILVAQHHGRDAFEPIAKLLRSLCQSFNGRFLAFADSRKMVEIITAAANRNPVAKTVASGDEDAVEELSSVAGKLLPYRAGYEAEDRQRIQSALSTGELKGVISTSALELGLDIGELDLVVMLNTPPSVKAFRQRLGRVGRMRAGECIVLDTRKLIGESTEALTDYLARPSEPNWLYLGNRYAQYANALCAAAEAAQLGGTVNPSHFESLPGEFMAFVENELNPVGIVPSDLYPLKQAAQGGAHREFPVRNCIEKTFKVLTGQGERKGELNLSQALREAYPGAVHYYMATPYRVRQFNYRAGEITVTRERHFTTKPISQVMVFPDFSTGLLRSLTSADGFLAEVEMQVNERVTGFKEKRGNTETSHTYGPTSPFNQQPLTRFIRTTGVCWFFPQTSVVSEALAASIVETFCNEHGIQVRDLGVGRFHAQNSPLGGGVVNGICIFDNTNGSLRLTERLLENFTAVVQAAINSNQVSAGTAQPLQDLAGFVAGLQPAVLRESRQPGGGLPADQSDASTGWVKVVSPGAAAIYLGTSGPQEVKVLGHFFTPGGIHYHLEYADPKIRWMVHADALQPLNGLSEFSWFNPMTGELKIAA